MPTDTESESEFKIDFSKQYNFDINMVSIGTFSSYRLVDSIFNRITFNELQF